MLIEFYGQNFGCFRDEFRLSMLATEIDPESDRGIVEVRVEGDDEPLRLLRAVALYGANASGKSTLLRAAGALSHLLAVTSRLASDTRLAPFEPFALGSPSRESVTLGAKAVIEGRVYDYSISFDRVAFLAERLVHCLPDGARRTLIDRNRQDVSGEWTENAQFELVAKEFRPNALLLSLGDSLAPGLAKHIAVGMRRLLRHSDALFPRFLAGTDVAERTREDSAFSDWLLARLRTADVGVIDVRREEIPLQSDIAWRALHRWDTEDSVEDDAPRRKKHAMSRLSLLHAGRSGPTPLPYEKESLGTQRIVQWSPLLYDLTHADKPRAAFVDEFDASMHPVLLRALIEHFNCEVPVQNARGQLIFATHETSLLDDEAKDAVLRRDQIYFTEKDSSGAARLFSVAEFKERNNLNIRRRYLQGRYGALPAVGAFTE
ncbi:MAG TPA: ATP-binding protein [Phycisphaerae bacterium]